MGEFQSFLLIISKTLIEKDDSLFLEMCLLGSLFLHLSLEKTVIGIEIEIAGAGEMA